MKKILTVIVLLILTSACSHSDKRSQLDALKKEHDKIAAQIATLEKELNPKDTIEAQLVAVQPLSSQVFDHYIEVQGRVDGNENIGVSPRTPGVVTKIYVKEGDAVKKGQILADLDSDVLKQTLKEMEDQLDFATDLYNRQKALWDQKIGSEVDFLKAKNAMEGIQNKISTFKDQIKMASITSPVDGTIEEIPVRLGQMAAAGAPAFRVINFSKPKAVAEVGETYSSKIRTGDQVKVYLPDAQTEQEQKVTFASKYINPTNRTFTVEIALDPQAMLYRANMIAVIRIKDYSNPSTIAIPQNYIQASGNEGSYVFIAKEENGKKVARKIAIKTGITYNGLTEVTEGLHSGDKIITAGFKDLYDGQAIDFK